MTRPTRSAAVLLAGALLALTACKDEQRLYSYNEQPQATPAATMPQDAIHARAAMPNDAIHAPMMRPGAMGQAAPELAPVAPPDDRPHLPDDATVTSVSLVGLSFAVPTSWGARTPASSMRAAEYVVPAAEGSREGELVFFHFGPGGAGGTMANIQRWVGQMVLDPDSQPLVYQQQRGPLTITEVICFGTQNPSGMGVGPTEPQPGSGLHGIVVEGVPAGSLFVRLTGGEATVRAAEPALASMIASLELESE
ncbi:MAG: hypothetical protein KF858_01255 [Candidatus Sumerlaeia bacterium]|nr:hypothetical protein [Candidatus Sumerlaeia bacterium]